MEKVIYAKVGRSERPIFSASAKVDKAVFEGVKAKYVVDCLNSGLPIPDFREETRKTEEDK